MNMTLATTRMERAIFRAAAPRRSYPHSTRESSHRFGPCQVCGQHVSEVFLTPTDNGVRYLFGHEACITPLVSLHPMPNLTTSDVERLRLPAVRSWMAAGLRGVA